MKTAILFLILTACAFSQADTVGLTSIRSDTLASAWTHEVTHQEVAPSGEVVREWQGQFTEPLFNYTGIVQHKLSVGCPVCGSVEREEYPALTYAYNLDSNGVGQLRQSGLTKSDRYGLLRSEGNGYRAVTVSICADCGTVYHGRRKK